MTLSYIIEGWISDYDQEMRVTPPYDGDLLFENHGWDDTIARPPGCRCNLEAGDSECSVHDRPIPYTLPSRVPTQPDIDPTTLPMIRIPRDASRCYFCDEKAHVDVNGIPMCEACQHRYRRDK